MTIRITKDQLDRIEAVQQEIVKCFNDWDEKINAKQQPATIQDLDYWQGALALVTREIRRNQIPLEIQKLKYGTLKEQKEYDQWLKVKKEFL
jgi:hypothetical protein